MSNVKYTATGAGTLYANGEYTYAGEYNGKPYYTYVHSNGMLPDGSMSTTTMYLSWRSATSGWGITEGQFEGSITPLYCTPNPSADTTPETGAWTVVTGNTPAPSFTSAVDDSGDDAPDTIDPKTTVFKHGTGNYYIWHATAEQAEGTEQWVVTTHEPYTGTDNPFMGNTPKYIKTTDLDNPFGAYAEPLFGQQTCNLFPGSITVKGDETVAGEYTVIRYNPASFYPEYKNGNYEIYYSENSWKLYDVTDTPTMIYQSATTTIGGFLGTWSSVSSGGSGTVTGYHVVTDLSGYTGDYEYYDDYNGQPRYRYVVDSANTFYLMCVVTPIGKYQWAIVPASNTSFKAYFTSTYTSIADMPTPDADATWQRGEVGSTAPTVTAISSGGTSIMVGIPYMGLVPSGWDGSEGGDTPATPVEPHYLVAGLSTAAANGEYYQIDTTGMALAPNWDTTNGVYSNGSYVLIDDKSYWLGWTVMPIDKLTVTNPYDYYLAYSMTSSAATPDIPTDWSASGMTVTYVTGPSISVTTPVIITTNVGETVSEQLIASDNTGATVTFTLAAGSTLPAGLTLSSSGLISGTPTVESAATVYTINVSSNSGASTKSITVTINVRAAGASYPAALLVAGAGNTQVNGTYDFTTVQAADAPTVGDKWGMYEGNDMYCIKLISTSAYVNGSYQTVKRYALYATNTSNYAYYADTVTGNEWPDDSALTWVVYSSSYGGTSPAPTSVTATSPRVVLSRISAVSNTSNNFTFVSYNCPYTDSSSVPTADALYTCMVNSSFWQLKVEQTGGKYYWTMYNNSYSTATPMFKTFTGATSLSTLGWPWDRTDWNVESTISGIPIPEFSNLNGTETQNKGSFTGLASVWKTSMYDGTYTCYNYDINSATCKPYARFEATINGTKYCMYHTGSQWTIISRTGSTMYTANATAAVSGSGESRTVPYPWNCTWSMYNGSTQIVPLVIKGDGSDGGINYGDFIIETGSSTTRFVYSNGSVMNVSAEPKTTDIWTSQDGTKTISWDSTNKWWVYKNGTTSVYHTPAYTSATPYQFPWEYASDSWIVF